MFIYDIHGALTQKKMKNVDISLKLAFCSSISTRVVDRLSRGFDFRVGEGDDGDGAGRLPIGSP